MTTTSNATGRYIPRGREPRHVQRHNHQGGVFRRRKVENQEVKVGASLTLNLSLQVGGSSVVVEVSAVGNELQTMNATVGNTVPSIAIDNLPSSGAM